MNGGSEGLPTLGDGKPRRRWSRRSGTFLSLAAALVACAVVVAGLFLGGWLSTAPASSAPPISIRPSLSTLESGQVPSASPSVQRPSAPMITRVTRLDSTNGLVFLSNRQGDYLRATKDGGATWSELRPMPSAAQSFAAEFLDLDHGWRAYGLTAPDRGKGPASLKVARTTDGGKTWQDATAFSAGIETEAGAYNNVKIHFRDRSNGVLLITFSSGLYGGNGVQNWPPYFCGELTTADGGATWSAPKTGRCLVNATFVSDLLGYAEIMDEGWAETWPTPATQAVTMDGGRTWTDAKFPTDWVTDVWAAHFFVMQRRSDGTLRALCACGPADSLGLHSDASVISSSDGGKTWTPVGVSFGFWSGNAWFWSGGDWVGTPGEDRWITGPTPLHKLEVSEDGGLRWQPLDTVGFLDGDAPDNASGWSNGWLLTSTSTCPTLDSRDCFVTSSHLYSTDDGGRTVRPILTP
jgi:hypothetical protein